VAVKTFSMPQGLTSEDKEEYRQRFLREAHAAGRLSYPDLIRVGDTQLRFAAIESSIPPESPGRR
jgi:hypothetical protein